MRILNYCAGYDTGGYSIRLKQAFDAWSEYEYRSCIGRPVSYIRYPTDRPIRELGALAKWADVIHVSHQPVSFKTDKPQVVQYHGTKFRNNPDKFLAAQRQADALAVCSTLDLWLLAPDMMEWLPTPYDMEWLARFRRPIRDGVLRVAHAPTNRAVKSTAALVSAVNRLAADVQVELVLIEKRPWSQCLVLKGTADIYFDQVILGYGNNAVEAWGMGIPVIAGAQPATLSVMAEKFGLLPFVEATEDTIYEALVSLVNPEARDWWSHTGRTFARRWHSQETVVRIAETVYDYASIASPMKTR